MSQQVTSTASQNSPILLGIDWGDRKHDVFVIDIDGQPFFQSFEHDPEAIIEWFEQLRARFPNRILAVAIEQSRGALVHALAGTEGLEIYPVNPKQLSRYRDALHPTGAKNDPDDAELLATFLLHYRSQLRLWKPDTVETRTIAYLCELRRKLVDERKSLGLRLISTLKLYFPLAITLFRKTTISDFLIDLLIRWPTLEELKRSHPRALRDFFRSHRIYSEDQQTQWIDTIRSATPLTKDVALTKSHALYIQCIARQVAELNRGIAELEKELRQCVAQHPDAPIFDAIPGAGEALVPRLIAAFGSDRDRYQEAQEVQNYSGIAPITRQSGQSRQVLQRVACPKFMKQTFHEFADQARRWSSWSKAYYEYKRSKGMKHQAAVRALAYKWIRLLFRLWKTRATYSESHYIEQLRRKQSPAIAFL